MVGLKTSRVPRMLAGRPNMMQELNIKPHLSTSRASENLLLLNY